MTIFGLKGKGKNTLNPCMENSIKKRTGGFKENGSLGRKTRGPEPGEMESVLFQIPFK